MCDAVTEEIIRIVHTSTTKQLVDLLTKALRRIQFHHLFKLGVQNLDILSRREVLKKKYTIYLFRAGP